MVAKARKSTRSSSASALAPATERDVRVRVFEGHTDTVYRVAMPEDGRFALTSGNDGTVRRWALDADETKSEIVCTAARGVGLAVTADGSYAATGDRRGAIHLIDLSSGLELRQWQGGKRYERVRNLAFLAEGREVLSAGDAFLRRWDSTTGNLIAKCRVDFNFLSGVAASADGRQIVGAAWQEGLALWSADDRAGSLVARRFRESVASTGPVTLSADGRIAFTGTRDGEVTQWDLVEGRRVAAFEGHSRSVNTVMVTPDGRFCVSGSDDESVRLWAVETGQCLAILRGHTNWVTGVAVTPDARRIASVSSDYTLRVWELSDAILARAATSRKRGYLNAKVVLLGDSGVGKTGLALRLWHDRWEKTESSHGMEIQRLALPQAGGDPDVEREVWLWDLAGQPDYRLTHQLFMEQTSLALLVFDPQDPKVFDTVGYWQSALRKVARAGNVAGVLVAARCDRPGLRLTMDEIRAWAEARGLRGPILTVAKSKKHAGAEKLRALIAELLPWDMMEFRSTMENFPALKDAILTVYNAKDAGVVVTPKELETRVRKVAPDLAFTPEDLRAVTGLLAGEGVLHALPYGDLVVLQPSWVNSYASTLVKLAGEDEDHLGHVPLATIQPGQLPDDGTPRLPAEDERQLLPALVALFLERALAWKQDTDKGAMLVFPSYVRLPRPEPPPRPGRTVLYRFTGPLEEIYSTLVVRLHYSGLFDKTKLYRQAVDFQTATGRLAALTMKEEGERGELEIYFGEKLDPDVQASFQRFVHDHLKAKASGLERLRNFFCPKCKEEVTDRKAIDAALTKNRTKIVCNYCDPDDPGVIDLNDVLEQQLASGEGEAGADRAARKAHDEITSASKEGVMVGEVQTIVFAVDQIYRTINQPDEGIDGEIEFRDARKRATGLTYRVQLKAGDSHLKKLKDGTEKFPMKRHYEKLWAGTGTVPVLLIVRSSKGRIRYMNATDAIRAAQKANPGQPVKQLVFIGEDFTREAVLRLRDERLKA
jgi:WD40 repeat protein